MDPATLASGMEEHVDCPSCGGAGGGPFGPAGSAWDDDDYVCPRCKGQGKIILEGPGSVRPGLVKAAPGSAEAENEKRKATG